MTASRITSILTILFLFGLIATAKPIAVTAHPNFQDVEPGTNIVYLPFLAASSIPADPPEMVLFCANLDSNLPVPDNDETGIQSSLQIDDPRLIADLDVLVDIPHTWVGDLTVNLIHEESGRGIRLIDRPGIPATVEGCGADGVSAILDDELSARVDDQCGDNPAAIAGIYTPEEPLSSFIGQAAAGTWILQVADHGRNDTGSLRRWCLSSDLTSTALPPPVDPPVPDLPNKAYIEGFRGKDQALPLDCESRVAVDWAKFFGVEIDEFEFFERLPLTGNPDTGFVGDVMDSWGQVPPDSYGVHAEPIAALLRSYGLNASARRPLSLNQLKAEVAAGRPVIVWVIGSASMNEVPIYYRAPDGFWSIVAHFEHTVTVTGYTRDSITIQDGDSEYIRTLPGFLSSWSALGNMAVTYTQ